ncbi:MAG: ribosome small subunit-dependent GTPase A, partial [Gemmatimonadaceae bacterium]
MANIEFERLRGLGWTEQRALQFDGYITTELRPARVIAIHRGVYIVHDAVGERRAKLSGRLRHRAQTGEFPAVGDWVGIVGEPNGESVVLVEHVLQRTTALIRGEPHRSVRPQVLAANVDVVLLAAALPDRINVRRLERAVAL